MLANENAQATYEQCLWDKPHVNSIYPILEGNIVADSEWHDFPNMDGDVRKYRVYQDKYFQAIFANAANPASDHLLEMKPAERRDDSEWTIWLDNGVYGLTSVFTVTPLLDNYGQVEDWLNRHDLGWEPHENGIQGVAYFTEIEAGCLADAMDRLVWLENVVIDLNKALNECCQSFWRNIKHQSDDMANPPFKVYSSDEIIPVPAEYPRDGWKSRQAVTEDWRELAQKEKL